MAGPLPIRPLAARFDDDTGMRNLMRQEGRLTRWMDEKCMGVPSCKHLALNQKPVEIVFRWWIEQTTVPKSPPIDPIRQEAGPSAL